MFNKIVKTTPLRVQYPSIEIIQLFT